VEPFSFSLNSLMMLVTLAAVCFGLLAAAPGLGVFVCVILLPVMIRTALVVRRREAAGLDVSPGTKVGLFFGSFAAASVIAVVVAGAAFGSFCLSCLGAFAVTNGRSESLALTIAFVVAGAVTLLISIPMAKWVKRRYRRDSTVD
jgi:MFS-type transporter involved in bile tolerance (Atg22 family)